MDGSNGPNMTETAEPGSSQQSDMECEVPEQGVTTGGGFGAATGDVKDMAAADRRGGERMTTPPASRSGAQPSRTGQPNDIIIYGGAQGMCGWTS